MIFALVLYRYAWLIGSSNRVVDTQAPARPPNGNTPVIHQADYGFASSNLRS